MSENKIECEAVILKGTISNFEFLPFYSLALLYVFFISNMKQGSTDTSTAESGSDFDEVGSPVGSRGSWFTPLDRVHEEVSF